MGTEPGQSTCRTEETGLKRSLPRRVAGDAPLHGSPHKFRSPSPDPPHDTSDPWGVALPSDGGAVSHGRSTPELAVSPLAVPARKPAALDCHKPASLNIL